MIITKLIGGLGNQIFQYAIGRCLAYKNQTKLKLDISGFKTYKLHKYSLRPFNIPENFAWSDEVTRFKKRGIDRLMEKFKPYNQRSFIKEPPNPCFDSNILKSSGDVYLEGYWQSEKYFKDIENIIRKEFTMKDQLKNRNEKMTQNIINANSVSLHIRRGDYVSNPRFYQKFGVCSLDYYKRAINKLAGAIENPHFFIFSDDIEWARNNLKLNWPTTFVSGDNIEDYEELILISKCKHHIIANSSFSWWGAWLSNNPDKIIFAPKKWFNDNLKNTSDLIPESWIRI